MGFYSTILMIALVTLILIMTYIGISLYRNRKQSTFPSTYYECPDYWTTNVNEKGEKTGCTAPKTKGVNQQLNINDPLPFNADRCKKREWSLKNNITWDGVSNYANCDTKK